MRLTLTAFLIFTVGLINPISSLLSVSSEDNEGSGYDLDSSGSGSGDDSVPDKTEIITVQPNSKDVGVFSGNTGRGNKNTLHASSGLTFDNTPWPAGDSEFIFIESSMPFWEHHEVRAALIAGGVTGAVFAALLMAILIFQIQTKDEEGLFLSRKKTSDEHNRKVIV